MKKFIAILLAAAMVLSLSAIAAAARPNGVAVYGNYASTGIAMVGPFDYDADTKCMSGAALSYGDSAYYLLLDKAGNPISNYSAVEKMKIKSTFEMGGDIVDSVSVTKKNVKLTADTHPEIISRITEAGHYYFVCIKTEHLETTVDTDVIGQLTFSRKEVDLKDSGSSKGDDPSGIEDKIDSVKIDFAFNVFYGDHDYIANSDDYILVTDSVDLKWDRDYALKFDSDDEIDLTFGFDNANEGVFTVDVSGQNKIYLKYNTNADDDIADSNPDAKMFFVNFNGVKFNRVGEFVYEMENGAYAYKVVDGKLVEIPGCEYDDSDEAFYFRTRVLENYVFSDRELLNPVDDTVIESPVIDAVVTNPSTGVE